MLAGLVENGWWAVLRRQYLTEQIRQATKTSGSCPKPTAKVKPPSRPRSKVFCFLLASDCGISGCGSRK
jgi:hypothetical protein